MLLILWLLLLPVFGNSPASSRYKVTSSKVIFTSDAPLEMIKATSDQLLGLMDIPEGLIAFKIASKTFSGFNSDLQKEHFNENYLRSDKYLYSTFSGKIIDPVTYDQEGVYPVRVKGILTVNGVAVERILKGTLMIDKGKINISSDFDILLSDHEIRIPRIVNQKIASEIHVSLKATLVRIG